MGKPKSSRRRNRQARGYILGSRSFSSSANQSQSSGESSRFIQAQSAILSQAPEQAISQSPTPSIASSSYKTAETQVSASSYHTAIRQVASNNENDEILPSKPATPTPATIPRAASQLGESSSAIHRQLPQVASELDESTSSLTPAPKSKLTSQVDSGPHSTMPISKIVSQIDEGDSSTTPNPRPKAASQIGENAPSPITPGLVSQLAREISGSNSFPRRPCPTNPVLYNPLTPSRKSGNVPRPTRRRGNDLNLEKADITPKSKANYPSMLEHSKSPADKKIDSIKKSLNVDSPSFTPATLSVPGKGTGGTISSQAVNAAPFTPRGMASGTSTPNAQLDAEPAAFNPAQIKEFTPQNYDMSQTLAANGANADSQVGFDPFQMTNLNQAMPTVPYNPYLEENTNLASNGAAYYQTQTAFATPAQPLQYHLYAPVGPHREDLLPYQRLAHDFFMSNELREELQKKGEATLQVMPNSQLPNIDPYHTLVALDTSQHKRATVFGYPSWVYKATNSKKGYTYCLRRLEGFRLTNEGAIKSVKKWQNVDNGGVVSVIDAFTTRAFGDSSLIFVLNYHPLSKTLVEQHFTSTNRYGNRVATTISLNVMWNYIVQIASAIKAVHAAKLAVRCMDPSKVIVTSENRIRFSGCSVLDVVHFDLQRSLEELQQEDFVHFGKLILAIGTNNLLPNFPIQTALEQLGRTYNPELRNTVAWLLTPAEPSNPKKIEDFVSGISGHVIATLDNNFQQNDTLTSELAKELESSRLFRLIAKLGTINERAEFENDQLWSETGPRYMLKLFRDFVFHQVDGNGKPVVDMAHILRSLNKLDAGIEERITLMSRDEQTVMVVTYKELKKEVTAAFADLQKQPAKGRY